MLAITRNLLALVALLALLAALSSPAKAQSLAGSFNAGFHNVVTMNVRTSASLLNGKMVGTLYFQVVGGNFTGSYKSLTLATDSKGTVTGLGTATGYYYQGLTPIPALINVTFTRSPGSIGTVHMTALNYFTGASIAASGQLAVFSGSLALSSK